jgi:tripartite-type tricarboxylate transporter receptor subunit TctC
MQTADMKQRLHDDGIVPVGSSRPQFAAYIKAELVKWADVVRRSGARID